MKIPSTDSIMHMSSQFLEFLRVVCLLLILNGYYSFFVSSDDMAYRLRNIKWCAIL